MSKKYDFAAIAIMNADNVATALREIALGESITVGIGDVTQTLTTVDAITFGHKLALADMPAGTDIVKYGAVIGRSTAAIKKGAHAHVHNIESLRGRGDKTEGDA